MRLCTTFVFVMAAAAGFAPAAVAQHQRFTVTPEASEVTMTLNTNHEVVHGRFQVQAGVMEFDPDAKQISGSVVVLSATGKTGNGLRDKRMDGSSILNVEKYATVTFEANSFTGPLAPQGDSAIQVTGIFTLLGTPHEITVPMQVHLDAGKATAKGHFVVPYVKWGLKNPSLMLWKADDDVAIDLSLVGKLS